MRLKLYLRGGRLRASRHLFLEGRALENRVCIFVDGENFRHSIVQLFSSFDRSEYLPKKANWARLFDWLVEKISPKGERIRTYWYVIQSLDFFPYKFPKIENDPDKLKRLLSQDTGLKDQLNVLQGDELMQKMKEIVHALRDDQISMRRRFDGWTAIQDAIATRHAAIEFRRAGAIRYNLFDRSLGPEKAVDVKLAVDLIMFREIYDLAIIVTGDQDYVPAVQVVKDFGKHVVNVAFETRGGKLLPQGAWRLNQITDWSFNIPYKNIAALLGIEEEC